MQISSERRQWKRFGAAARETADDSVTVRHVEDIPFERIRPAKATAQEKKFTDMQVGGAGGVSVIGHRSIDVCLRGFSRTA